MGCTPKIKRMCKELHKGIKKLARKSKAIEKERTVSVLANTEKPRQKWAVETILKGSVTRGGETLFILIAASLTEHMEIPTRESGAPTMQSINVNEEHEKLVASATKREQ